MKIRRVHLKDNEIVEVMVEGKPAVCVMLSKDGEWVNVETIADAKGIAEDTRAKDEICRAKLIATGTTP